MRRSVRPGRDLGSRARARGARVASAPAGRAPASGSGRSTGPVARPFRAAADPLRPGHLGVDFAARPGTPVRAAGAGTVVFAGRRRGHPPRRGPATPAASGPRTPSSPSIRVRTGQVVAPGAWSVRADGRTRRNHDGATSCTLGLRIGERLRRPDAAVRPARPSDRAPILTDPASHLAPGLVPTAG